MWGVVRAAAGVAAAAVVAGAGMMGASAATGSGANLLPNGSFDNGSISGWGATSAKLSLATPGYNGSAGALKVAWTGSGSAYTLYASPRPASNVAAGTAVVGGGEVWGVAGRNICVLLQEHSASGSVVQTVHLCAVATGAWQTLPTVTLTDQTSGDSVGFMVRQYGAQSGDSFLADSLTVTEGASPTPTTTVTSTATATSTATPTGTATPAPGNLLPNGTFDSNSVSGWKSSGGTLTVASPGQGGTPNAAKITYGGTATSYNLWANPKPVTSATAGEQLTANGYVMGISGRTLCLQLIEHSSTGSTVLAAQTCVLATGSWQPLGPTNLTVKNAGDSVGFVVHQTKPQAGDWFEADTLSLTGPSSTSTPTPTPTQTGTGTAAAIWNMDETSGTVMHDSSANANNGNIIGPVKIGQAGHVGTSYFFPGPTGKGYVDVPASASLSPSAFNGGAGASSVDISFWIHTVYKPTSADFDLVRDGVYPDNEYKTELQTNGQVSCSFHGTSSGPQIQGGPDIADGKWHHIECVETPNSITLYVDGAQVATQTVAIGTVNTSSSDATIGSHGTFDWYQGKLDDVTITFS
jgi:hypothetical protein